MSNTLNGGWILVWKKIFENENIFCVGNMKFEIVVPEIEGIYFTGDSTRCYRFGIETEVKDNIETFDTTYVFPCHYDLKNMTIKDEDGIVKNLVLNDCGDILFLNEYEIYFQILPENTEQISHLESEFKFK